MHPTEKKLAATVSTTGASSRQLLKTTASIAAAVALSAMSAGAPDRVLQANQSIVKERVS